MKRTESWSSIDELNAKTFEILFDLTSLLTFTYSTMGQFDLQVLYLSQLTTTRSRPRPLA